jgi:thiol-disulfide isomerase/thioredoxin
MTSDAAQSSAKRRLSLILAGGIAGVAVGLAGVYGISLLLGKSAVDPACQPAVEAAQRIAPFARGEVAAMAAASRPIRLPEMTFRDANGAERSLSDWRGRTVLFNLWATWCVPCRQEMPALDRLQGELGGRDFQVVAINVDTRNPDKPRAWLQENGIRNLAYYADPAGRLLQVLQKSGHVVGLPTTFLVDPSGCEIALLKGPAEWDSPDALAFMRAALGRP